MPNIFCEVNFFQFWLPGVPPILRGSFFGENIIFWITKLKILGNGEKLKIQTSCAQHFSYCDLFRILTPWGTYCVKSGNSKFATIFVFAKVKILKNAENLEIETPRGECFSRWDLPRIFAPWGTSNTARGQNFGNKIQNQKVNIPKIRLGYHGRIVEEHLRSEFRRDPFRNGRD